MIKSYAINNYKKMLRQPEGQLKHPFIVPGSVYANQLWDWDCWLTNVALRQFVEEDITQYEHGCVLNFLEHIDEQGRIPLMITGNSILPGNLRNPGQKSNMHKPCLAQHGAFLIQNAGGDAQWLRDDFSKLLRFVDCYRENFRHENGLYFWHDDAAIGVDNDPSTFYRPADSSGSIYLNCMMYKELLSMAYICNLMGMNAAEYETAAIS